MIEKKSFKESTYDNDDLYFDERNNFNNHYELFNRNERFDLDFSLNGN